MAISHVHYRSAAGPLRHASLMNHMKQASRPPQLVCKTSVHLIDSANLPK